MKAIIIIYTLCLLGVIFANPIPFSVVLESNELDSNSTESLAVSQSSENDTSEMQSSEEINSSQSSESESLESASDDRTSEESSNESSEEEPTELVTETRDDSMGSEENVRKSWVRVFVNVAQDLSAEDNSSAEAKGQSEEHLGKTTSSIKTLSQSTNTNLVVVGKPTDSSDTSSESADTSDSTAVTAATSDSSESTSSESNETIETSETSDSSDSSDASQSTEDSNTTDSTELQQSKLKDCVNGTQSCESEEYFFQDIGDDAHDSVDNLMMMLDEDERELSLRR